VCFIQNKVVPSGCGASLRAGGLNLGATGTPFQDRLQASYVRAVKHRGLTCIRITRSSAFPSKWVPPIRAINYLGVETLPLATTKTTTTTASRSGVSRVGPCSELYHVVLWLQQRFLKKEERFELFIRRKRHSETGLETAEEECRLGTRQKLQIVKEECQSAEQNIVTATIGICEERRAAGIPDEPMSIFHFCLFCAPKAFLIRATYGKWTLNPCLFPCLYDLAQSEDIFRTYI
jgi:hypothetical protein